MGKNSTAVLLAVLMVVSTVTPFAAVAGAQSSVAGNQATSTAGNQPTATPTETAAMPTETASDDQSTPADTNRSTPGSGGDKTDSADNESQRRNYTNAPPALKKSVASRQIRTLDASGHADRANKRSRAHDLINGTLPYYRGPVRLNDSAAFTDDAAGVRALGSLYGTDGARRAARLVYEADNESARVAVTDARRALARYGDEMENQGQRRAAESHLDNAERALDRADRAAARGDGRGYFKARAKAITNLRTAHHHANAVLRFVDRETGPTVSIDSVSDPVRNGSTQVTYTVTGNVTDVRPQTIANVTVAVNGDRTVRATTTANATTPARTARYSATVTLTERVNVVEVTVTDSTRSDAGEQTEARKKPGKGERAQRENGGNGKNPGNSADDRAGGLQRDTAVLSLDGDGLSQDYERNATGTDPLDPDSDSNGTDANEADNETIDGREDFDSDGLTTLQERKHGTHPLDADTDGDGLSDREELLITNTAPLAADSDGDGTPDGDEDPDGDGLGTARELDVGSMPTVADGDDDGLRDPAELANGTGPLNPDSDDDLLRDGDEVRPRFDTDPLDEDTDDDGTLDGNETYTTSVRNDSLGATVDLTGTGNVAATSTVESPAHARFTSERAPTESMVGESVHVDVDRNFSSASVTLDYNESAVKTNESAVALYRFNETTGAYERLPSTVDAANDTVTATASHFSVIAAFDSQYASNYARERQNASPTSSGSSQVFEFETDEQVTLDSGESTTVEGARWTCRNDPRGGPYSDTPVSGTCAFRDGAAFVEEETNRKRYLEHTTTLPDAGADEAVYVETNLTAYVEAEWSNAAVTMVLEDENGDEVDVFRMEQDYAGDTHTVSANPRVDVTEYAGQEVTISFRSDGRWTYDFQNTNSWIEVDNFSIESTSGAMTDSDGDGISDAWESGGVPLANTTRTVHLDSQDPDTDGDGKLDGDEVDMDTYLADQNTSDDDVIHFPGFAWSSDPRAGDTDGDGISDEVEREGWTVNVTRNDDGDPYRWDADGSSGETMTVGSDPLSPNSDDDGLSDAREKQIHTDPEAEQTYAITAEHETDILERLDDEFGNGDQNLDPDEVATLDALNVPTSSSGSVATDLTDATADVDFVTDDGENVDGVTDRLVFTALDTEKRTDTWLSNGDEIDNGTDVWDPDTDEDGLTDGQEVAGVTGFTGDVDESPAGIGADPQGYKPNCPRHVPCSRQSLDVDPLDNDTDGDGYWDGWMGVYGVSRENTTNHILYMEHLDSGAGVTGDEVLPQQVGTHEVDDDAPGTTLPDGSERVHSNLHLGELHWDAIPGQSGNTPSPTYVYEVDYYVGDSTSPRAAIYRDHGRWASRIEKNFGLYGIDVKLVKDQRFDELELEMYTTDWSDGDRHDYDLAKDLYESNDENWVGALDREGTMEAAAADPTITADCPSECTYRYLLVDSTGIGGKGLPTLPVNFVGLDRSGTSIVSQADVSNADTHEDRLFIATSNLAVHEIGHLLFAGEYDDDGLVDEAYSGDQCFKRSGAGGSLPGTDGSYELLDPDDEHTGCDGDETTWSGVGGEWSAMSRAGTGNDPAAYSVTDGKYTAFSIEELVTVGKPENVNYAPGDVIDFDQ